MHWQQCSLYVVILHNQPVKEAKVILNVATPNTKLILLKNIVPYTVVSIEQNTPGDKVPVPPAPLLPNLGAVNLPCYFVDIHVHARLFSLVLCPIVNWVSLH
jgi:hypothetical protein